MKGWLLFDNLGKGRLDERECMVFITGEPETSGTGKSLLNR